MIKLMKHYATNGKIKARCWYHRSPIKDRDCVTIYAKDYTREFDEIFQNTENDSDSMTDYFEKSRFRVYPDSPLWEQAVARSER